MRVLLDKKIKEVEDESWKLKFNNHELAVKDLVVPVVGVIQWAKEFVGTALEPSPYASLAWSSVCLLLPVSSFLFFSPNIKVLRFSDPFS